jgi:hypothetical protein
MKEVFAIDEKMSKRSRGFPSEKNVSSADAAFIKGEELTEKLGSQDLCPCGSGRRFQQVLSQ